MSDDERVQKEPGTSTALVRRQEKAPHLSDDVAMQKLWLATQRREWRSLAVVAADDDVSTLEVATRLAEIAWWYRGQPTNVFDLRELGLRLVDYQLREIEAQVAQGDCVIIALSSIFANPTTIAVATAADAAVLCVKLGATKMKGAEKTIREIGQAKFLGSIAINPAAPPPSAPKKGKP